MELLFHVQICGILEPFADETDLARESRSLVILPLIHSVTKKVLTIPHDAQAGTVARIVVRHHCHSCDEKAKPAGLRGSLPVLDRLSYLAACRVQGLVRIWTKCFNEYGLEDIDTAVEETLKTLRLPGPLLLWHFLLPPSHLIFHSQAGPYASPC